MGGSQSALSAGKVLLAASVPIFIGAAAVLAGLTPLGPAIDPFIVGLMAL